MVTEKHRNLIAIVVDQPRPTASNEAQALKLIKFERSALLTLAIQFIGAQRIQNFLPVRLDGKWLNPKKLSTAWQRPIYTHSPVPGIKPRPTR